MKQNDNKIVLSICIPTYNRKTLLKEILDEILRYPYNDIEIIVIDNASTDGTKELLDSYHDLRLRVKFNEQNIGMTNNQVLAAFSGNGKYTLVLIDRDKLDSRKLVYITKRLHQLDMPIILLDYKATEEVSIYGGKALSAAVIRTHPSFLIYHTQKLHNCVKINDLYKMILSDKQLPYAYTGVIGVHLLADCSKISVLPNSDAITLEIKKVPSYAQYGIKHKTIYYEPEASLKRYTKYMDILKQRYSANEYKKYVPYVYTAEFSRGVLSHYQNSHGRYMARKYKIKKKSITEYNRFYIYYLKQAIDLMIRDNKFSIKNFFIINIASWCLLFKIYCAEKPFKKCEKLIKISNKFLDIWLYPIA